MYAVRKEEQKGMIFWQGSPGSKTIMSSSPEPWFFGDAIEFAKKNPGFAVYRVRGFIKKKIYPLAK